MSVEDLKSEQGSVESLQRTQELERRLNKNNGRARDDANGRLFWAPPQGFGSPYGTNNHHPFIIRVEEANPKAFHSPPIKTTVLEDVIPRENFSGSQIIQERLPKDQNTQNTQNTQEEPGKKKKKNNKNKKKQNEEKPPRKPFSLFSFCRKADKKKTAQECGTGTATPPSTPVFGPTSPLSDTQEDEGGFPVNGADFFQPVSKSLIKRNEELPSLHAITNAQAIHSLYDRDVSTLQHQELEDLSSVYSILNARDQGFGDLDSVIFEKDSYVYRDRDISRPQTEEPNYDFGSRPQTRDRKQTPTAQEAPKSPPRSLTAGIRPVHFLPPLQQKISSSPPVAIDATPESIQDSLECWMSCLSPDLRRVPLNHLFIPGSHDSFSFGLSVEEQIGPDCPEAVANLDSCCPCMARPAILRWCITQNEAVTSQLKHGIRYFDIRVAVRNSRFFFVHGIYGDDLEPLLSEINHFLVKHPGEVVLLDFQHFHGLSAHDHAALTKLLKKTFSDLLCPSSQQLKHLTLSYLTRLKYQVLVFYRHQETMQAVSWLWASDSIPNPWPHTTSVTKMISFLEDNLKKRNPQTFFVTQCILTPSGKYLVRHVKGDLERDMASPCNSVVEAWVSHLPQGPQGPNIVMTDFVEQENWAVPRAVVDRNTTSLLPLSSLQRY